MRRRRVAALALLPIFWSGGGAMEAGSPRAAIYVLGPEGRVFHLPPGASRLEPGGLPWDRVNHLAALGGGERLLVLLPGGEGTGRKHGGGQAVVVDVAAERPTVLKTITLSGEGRAAAMAADGRQAWVIVTRRPVEAPGQGPLEAIEAIDLETGRARGSAVAAPGSLGIAADPSGRRIYLSLPDRIQTYTTSPLAASWHYRSPGRNAGLLEAAGLRALCVARGTDVALFDEQVLAGLPPEARRSRADEATSTIPLPFEAAALQPIGEAGLVLAWGSGPDLALVDLPGGRILELPAGPGNAEGVSSVRPLPSPPGAGRALVALFPGLQVIELAPLPAPSPWPSVGGPPPPAMPPPAVAVPSSVAPAAAAGPAGAEPGPATVPGPTPAAVPEIPAATAPTPPPARSEPPPTPGLEAPVRTERATLEEAGRAPALRGRLTGKPDLVESVVLYGPGSIIREQGRVRPGPDGAWEVPAPAPGVYRVLPLGPGSRPVRAVPIFRTVTVNEGESVEWIDFQIKGVE